MFNLINLWLFFFKEYKLLFLLDVLFQETIWNVRLFHRHPILVCYTSLNHQVNWMKRESREKKKGFHGCTAPKDMERIIRVLLVRQGCKMKNSFIILFFIFGCWIIINKIWFEVFIFISSKKGWKQLLESIVKMLLLFGYENLFQ